MATCLNIPDPRSAQAILLFADADLGVCAMRTRQRARVPGSEPATEDYQRLIEEARGVPVTPAAAVPLVSGIALSLTAKLPFGDRNGTEACF